MADDAQRFRNILPYLAVAETIATRGKSPGTTALQGEQIFRDAEERKRKADEGRKAAAARELQMRLGEFQFNEAKKDSSRKDAARTVIKTALDTGTINGKPVTDKALAWELANAYGPESVISLLKTEKPQPVETPAEKRQAEQANRVEIEKLRLQDKAESRLDKQTENQQKENEKRKEKESAKQEKIRNYVLDLEDNIQMAKELKAHPGFKDVYGLGWAQTGEGLEASTMADQLQDKLTHGYMQKLKVESPTGAMGTGNTSDREFATFRGAASRIHNRWLSNAAAAKALDDVIKVNENLISKALGRQPIHKIDDSEYERELRSSSSGGQISSSSSGRPQSPGARKIGRFVVEEE